MRTIIYFKTYTIICSRWGFDGYLTTANTDTVTGESVTDSLS